MVATSLPPIEPACPEWFQRFARRLPDFYQLRLPSRPVKVPTFAATANLPKASDYTGCIVFNQALAAFCVSDGTYWYPLTMGAHL